MEVGEVSGFYKFVKPVSLSDIILDVEESTKDFIIFRIHCKYDTQATGDEIVEKLKKLDKLNKGIEILKNEIEQTKQIVDGLPEYEQQANMLFLDGLEQALNFIESE